MTKRSVTHATFTIERIYDASPERVFAAWSNAETKTRWFGCHEDWERTRYELDFRVGGKEVNISVPKETGVAHIYNAQYQDIVPNERFIYSYDMHLDETRISVSLATVELKQEGKKTRLTFTEQGAFLDGYDDVTGREEGTDYLLNALDEELQRQMVKA